MEPKPEEKRNHEDWTRARRRLRRFFRDPIVRRVTIAVLTYWLSRTGYAELWNEVKGIISP